MTEGLPDPRSAAAKHERAGSPFLDKLPPEVRQMIYRELFFGNGNVCRISQEPWIEAADKTVSLSSAVQRPLTSNIEALPLLLTCRQIHLEAVPVLYAGSRFQFTDLVALHVFLRRLPAPHAVRDVRLNWAGFAWLAAGRPGPAGAFLQEHWVPVCEALGRMRGLRRLRVRIRPEGCVCGLGGGWVCDERVLGPMVKILVEDFMLEI